MLNVFSNFLFAPKQMRSVSVPDSTLPPPSMESYQTALCPDIYNFPDCYSNINKSALLAGCHYARPSRTRQVTRAGTSCTSHSQEKRHVKCLFQFPVRPKADALGLCSRLDSTSSFHGVVPGCAMPRINQVANKYTWIFQSVFHLPPCLGVR